MRLTTPDVKQLNKERIREALVENGICTKSVIARNTGLSVTTCNTLINEMLKAGEISVVDQEDNMMGRPAIRYAYNTDYHHVMGIYLGDENSIDVIGYALADIEGTIHESQEYTDIKVNYDSVERVIAEAVEKDKCIKFISISIPGVSSKGVITDCDIKELEGVDIEARLSKKFNVPVEVRNDMDFFAWGLYKERNNDKGTLVALYYPISNGYPLGSGSVINGRLLRGASKFSGELSHLCKVLGVTRDEQNRRCLEDRDELISYLASMVMVLITTINPNEIVLMGMSLTNAEIGTIADRCCEMVDKRHVPALTSEDNVKEALIRGLVDVCIDKLEFPLSRQL